MQTLEQLKRGELKKAVSLKLSEGLSVFPEEIFELSDTLEVLDLSGNKLKELPPDFGKLNKLRIFFCSENQFEVLPKVLSDCPALDIVGFKSNHIKILPPSSLNPNLRWLILTDNEIRVLPPEIGLCKRMQKLMLAGNQLSALPEELKHCEQLSLLRISANKLKDLPQWLLSMPRLSWLAFSGNPFCKVMEMPSLPAIDWTELRIEQVLGTGASGVISRASRKIGEEFQELAIKVFKGAVTSDGFPEDERSASIAAGAHSGLVKLIGEIKGHPEGKSGLVMELIPERFFNLGLPPSLETCTRDVFKKDLSLSLTQVLKISSTIADLAAELHSKGMMHGDLYAHNTLIDNEGNTLFGDFGAASFYDTEERELADALQRLEVNAYGQLLDDLLSLCDEAINHPYLIKLSSIREECIQPNVAMRPGFNLIHQQLSPMLPADF